MRTWGVISIGSVAVAAVLTCKKAEQQPAPPADTTQMMSDTSKMGRGAGTGEIPPREPVPKPDTAKPH